MLIMQVKKVTSTNNVNKKVINANKKPTNNNNVSNDSDKIFDDILLGIENTIRSI